MQSAVSACQSGDDGNDNGTKNLEGSISAKLQHFTFRAASQESIEQANMKYLLKVTVQLGSELSNVRV